MIVVALMVAVTLGAGLGYCVRDWMVGVERREWDETHVDVSRWRER